MSWRLPSPAPPLAARRYLVRRRDCLQPIRIAVLQHPALAPMIRALFAFATDGILLAEERWPARCGHAPSCRSTYLVILPVAYIAQEMAGLRRSAATPCGRRRPAHHCCTAWPPTREAQSRLKWRLYSFAVPERLRHLLDSRLPEVLRIRDPADEIAAGR